MNTSYYYRDTAFLYQLRSHSAYWFYVSKSETLQTIMGLICDRFYSIIFDDRGRLIEVQQRPLKVAPPLSDDVDDFGRLSNAVEKEVLQVRNELGVADAAIRVTRFRVPDVQIGIADLPEDLQEYVDYRAVSGCTEEDLEEALNGWKEESLFVFWWGQSFYVNAEGEVASS